MPSEVIMFPMLLILELLHMFSLVCVYTLNFDNLTFSSLIPISVELNNFHGPAQFVSRINVHLWIQLSCSLIDF